MKIPQSIQENILAILSQAGPGGLTITDIEKQVSLERHTLSKYLSFMEGHGLLYHKAYGKAKAWFVNKAPLKTIFDATPTKRTFAENLVADLCHALPFGICILDTDYRIQFFSNRLKEQYGNQTNQKFYEVILGLPNPLRVKPLIDLLWGKQDTVSFETQDRHGNYLRINASRLVNPDKSASVMVIIDDITAKKKSELETKKLSQVVEQTADMVLITDKQGKIEYVNEAFERVTGYRAREILGKYPNILKSGKHSASFYKKIWDTLLKGKAFDGILVDKKKDGSFYVERKTITPIRNSRIITHFVSTAKLLTGDEIPARYRSLVA